MALAWPAMGDNPFADHVNSITNYVVASQPVDTTVWVPTVVIPGPDLLDEVSRLKQAEGGDILIWDTGQPTDALAVGGLLDEYRIPTAPVIKGGGEPLFRPASIRHLRAPRHEGLRHRRRRPRLPADLSPLIPNEPIRSVTDQEKHRMRKVITSPTPPSTATSTTRTSGRSSTPTRSCRTTS